ncbi:type II secretion system protein N [Gallaecimonas sp. GXIMD4217]|uniref:type II secretion system protein N n=1 Tax=Gallaecimonas sp. GXIMD4217 TaxID=3131927 RepID=UPI00311ABF8F
MKWLKWSLLGLLFFAFALVCQLPAALVLDRVTLPRGLVLDGVAGSLWSGEVRRLEAQGLAFERLRWSLRPSRLLAGELALELHAKPGATKLDGLVAVGFDGLARAENLSLRLPASVLAQQLRLPIPSQLGGQLSLILDQASQGQPWCETLAGEANWRQASLSNKFGNFELGRIQARLGCDGGAVTAVVRDIPARLGLELEGRLEAGRYSVRGSAQPAADQPKAIQDAFKLVAKPDASGRYPISFQGRL